MPNRQDTIDIINNALQSDNKKVIVLKGDWGIGKTYLWKEIAEKNDKHSFFDICHKIHWLLSSAIRAKKEYKTGYVSLFGKKDFNEITQEAILSLYFKHKPRNIFEWLLIKTKSFWFKLFGISNFQTITQSFSAVFALLGIYSLKNTIICFDDLERMDKNIDFKDFLGFVNDLSEHQECKVVLIFNEKELFNIEKVENITNENNDKNNNKQIEISDNQIIYNKFKEKTIDLEITYTPTFEDNFNVACNIINHNLEDKYKNIIKNLLSELHENNIRITSKCIECVNDFINAVYSIKDKLQYFDNFSNTILLEIIKSIAYISQQYWKAGHRFWDIFYIEKETSHLNDDKFIKAIKKYPNDYHYYIFQGKYLNALDLYFQGYSFDKKIIYDYLKEDELIHIYYNLHYKMQIYSNMFWNNRDGRLDEYANAMCDLFNNDENAYSFFINYHYLSFKNYIKNDIIIQHDSKFKEIFYNQMNKAIDKYIKEYQNNPVMQKDFEMIKKIKSINKDKIKQVFKYPVTTNDYINLLVQISDDDNLAKNSIIEQLDMDSYIKLYKDNNELFVYARSLFFYRKEYSLEEKIPHFLKIIAEDLKQSINDNPDNKLKYNILGKNNLNNPNYDIIKDINDYLEYYKNHYGDE